MRMQRSIPPFLLALCLLAGSQLVGCGTGDTAGTSRAQSDIGAPPILLRDPSPGQLAAYINVTIGGYEPTTSTLEGHPFSCTYSAGGTSATLLLTIPSAPVIRSPQDFAQVPRSPNTLITYEARGGKLLGIVALGPGAKAIAHLDTPRLLQATANTSAFTTGAGSLSLTQMLDLQVTQTGTPFKSLGAGGTAMTMVAVTWV